MNSLPELQYSTLAEVAKRWRCHKRTAARRIRKFRPTAILPFSGGDLLVDPRVVLEMERKARKCGVIELEGT